MAVRLPVDPNDDLDQIISKIRAQSSKDITLVLPNETRALQELNNFYALRNAVRADNVNLSFAGGNKTIRGLAKLLGFAVDKEGAGGDDDAGASEMFGNAATQASPAAGRASFGLPDGFVVAQPGGAPPPSAPVAPERPMRAEMPPPQVPSRSAQDFLNEMRDFNPGLPTAPLQPPPSRPNGNGNGNGFADPGDIPITRENVPDFFGASADGGDTGGSRRPPSPQPQLDITGGRTMSYDEAMGSGLFGGGGSLGKDYNAPPLDDLDPQDDDVPMIPTGEDNAAGKFRRPGGVRNPDEEAIRPARGRKPKPVREPKNNRGRDRAIAGGAVVGAVAAPSLVSRVRKIIVPVEPRAPGMGGMGKVALSPEEMKRRNAQRQRTGLLTIAAVLALLLLFVGTIFFLVLSNSGNGSDTTPQPQAQNVVLTIPLKTEERTKTVQMLLVPGGSAGSVQGTNQANPAVTAPAGATPGAAGVGAQPGATGGAASGTPGATGAAGVTSLPPAPPQPARLPFELVTSGEIKKSADGVATGTRPVPDKPASGAVTFFNAGRSPRGYGAGAVIWTAPNGVVYRLVQGITVGAGNPFSGARSQASGTVIADKAGPIGNQAGTSYCPAEAFCISVGNLAGGTERQDKIVTQGDLDKLKVQLQDQAKADANNVVKYDPATQGLLVFKAAGEPACTFNKKPNDTVDPSGKFNGTCTTSLEAGIYNKEAATKTAAAQLVDDPAYKLDESSKVEFLGEPKLVENNGQRALEWQIRGRIVPILDIEAFKTAIGGKPKAEIGTLVATNFPQVNSSKLNLGKESDTSLPAASRLTINTIPDYQVTTAPAGTPAAGETPLPGGGNRAPGGTPTR